MQTALHSFGDWLATTSLSQALATTAWAIPAIQSIHIICLAALFACALMFSMRVVGRGLVLEPLRNLGARLTRTIWMLLAVLLLTGILLITAEPNRALANPVFYTKMGLLVLAIIVTLWLSCAARGEQEKLTGLHRLGAIVAILLWIGIIFAGRFIAYVGSD